jgi:hypothetical protein
MARRLPDPGTHTISRTQPIHEEIPMLGTVLLVILVLMLVGALPTWNHSRSWGYAPSGVVGLLVVVLLIMLLTGNI